MLTTHSITSSAKHHPIHAIRNELNAHADSCREWPGSDADASWRWADHHLERVVGLLRQQFAVDGLLGESGQHQLRCSGSMLHARITLATCHCYGIDPDSAIYTAAACELLHGACVIREDLHDRRYARAGQLTVWHQFDTETAVSLGDFFLVRTYALLAEIPCHTSKRSALVATYSRAATNTLRGHSDESSLQEDHEATLEVYESAAVARHGSLFALAVHSALLLADAPLEQIRHATEAMKLLGLTHQISEDVDHMLSMQKSTSRPFSRQRTLMAPEASCFRNASAMERSAYTDFLRSRKGTKHDADPFWFERLLGSSGLEDCQHYLQNVRARISQHLEHLAPRTRICLEQVINQASIVDDSSVESL